MSARALARAVVAGAAIGLAACGRSGSGGAASSDAGPPPPELDSLPRVALETTKGRIVIELDRRRAPNSVANFLLLVRAGFYDGLTFHRVMPGFMIQAGHITADMQRRATTRPPIVNEADNALKNVRGSVAMARTSYPHSATTEFFINLVDNPTLDFTAPTAEGFGYAVFGRVVEGMDAVDAVAKVPTTRRAEFLNLPVEPIVITRASVLTLAPPSSPQ